MPWIVTQYLYERIPGSGVTPEKPLKPTDEHNWAENGVLLKFDQRELLSEEDFANALLEDYGYVYYPFSCIEKKCKAMIFFHGYNVDALIACQNIIPVAAANDMVVLFPGAKFGFRISKQHNWANKDKDFNDKYLTKEGLQIRFIMAAVKRL